MKIPRLQTVNGLVMNDRSWDMPEDIYAFLHQNPHQQAQVMKS